MVKWTGVFTSSDQGYLSYCVPMSPMLFMYEIKRILELEFNAQKTNIITFEDSLSMKFEIDGIILSITQKMYEGLLLVAIDEEGEKYVGEIGTFLNELFMEVNEELGL